MHVLALVSLSFLASSQIVDYPNSELETQKRARTVVEGGKCNARVIRGKEAFKREIENKLSTNETVNNYLEDVLDTFGYCAVLSGQVLGDPDSDACQTSIVYHIFLRVCRTVAVSVSSRDDCSEPYDNTRFRKLLVCQPQFRQIDQEVGSNEALIITDTDGNSLSRPGIWTDTGHCVMLICKLEEMAFLESVKSKVQKIKGKRTVPLSAL